HASGLHRGAHRRGGPGASDDALPAARPRGPHAELSRLLDAGGGLALLGLQPGRQRLRLRRLPVGPADARLRVRRAAPARGRRAAAGSRMSMELTPEQQAELELAARNGHGVSVEPFTLEVLTARELCEL